MTAGNTAEKPATAQDIREILGPVDEETVIEITRTGASRAEVQMASAWEADEAHSGPGEGASLSSRARGVYDIISRARADDGADER